MAGLRPTITATGLKEAQQECREAQKNLRNMRVTLKDFAGQIQQMMSDAFRNQADPRGVQWEPLAESTERARMGKAIGGRSSRYKNYKTDQGVVLRYEKSPAQRARETRRRRFDSSGAYKKRYAERAYKTAFGGGIQILQDTGRLKNSLVTRVEGNDTLVFGTNAHYGLYHQTGTKKMPARMFVPVELRNGRWATMTLGPAGQMWAKLHQALSGLVFSVSGRRGR